MIKRSASLDYTMILGVENVIVNLISLEYIIEDIR